MDALASKPAATFDCRVAFAETLIALAQTDERIVAVCNDSVGSSNLGGFQKLFPDRIINVGIAEQNMVGVGAGLANGGFIPFVCGAGPFLTGRALEQIKVDVAYNGFPVVLCGMSPGMAYGGLGPTHHSIEDLSWLRAIDGLAIVVPADPAQTSAAVRWAAQSGTPCYLRVGRTKVPDVTPEGIGRLRVRAGPSVARRIGSVDRGTGAMVSRALAAVETLAERDLEARVINVSTIKPLDEAAIIAAARETGAIVTVEEATIEGGLGPAVAETVVRNAPVPMRMVGVTGFAPTGTAEFLFDHFGLNAEGIVAAALDTQSRAVRCPIRFSWRSIRARAQPKPWLSTARAP